jgi:hypothetical protein
MKEEERNHKLIVQYLMGELSEEEKARLEQQYFNDDGLFEQVLAVEGELLDDYARGEMTASERERFEARLQTSPRQRRKAAITRALVNYATESSSPVADERAAESGWRSLFNPLRVHNRAALAALTAAALVFAVGVLLLTFKSARLNEKIGSIQAEALMREQELQKQLAQRDARNEELANELQRERDQRELLEQEMAATHRSTLGAVAFVLTPDLIRGGGKSKRLIIPQGANLVRLQIVASQDDFKSYSATLETVDGNRLWSGKAVKARLNGSGRLITLALPASLFGKGDYILALDGVNAVGAVERVGEYYFNVDKK